MKSWEIVVWRTESYPAVAGGESSLTRTIRFGLCYAVPGDGKNKWSVLLALLSYSTTST